VKKFWRAITGPTFFVPEYPLVLVKRTDWSLFVDLQAETFPAWVRVKNIFRHKVGEALAGIEVRPRKESVAKDEAEASSSSDEEQSVDNNN